MSKDISCLVDEVYCNRCSTSDKIVKHGFNLTARGKVQRYFCKNCNHNFNQIL